MRPLLRARVAGVAFVVDAVLLPTCAATAATLGVGLLTRLYPGWDLAAYVVASTLAAAGLYASLLLHEVAHALVARRMGHALRALTLSWYGAATHVDGRDIRPRAEILIALAGPAMSVLLALGAALGWTRHGSAPSVASAVLYVLLLGNAALAAINLLPIYPLDGGRVARALLWLATGDHLQATRMAAYGGHLVAIPCVLGGLVLLAAGQPLAGAWLLLTGAFFLSRGVRPLGLAWLPRAWAARLPRRR